MKPNTQLQKIISILMPFILMVEITGCYSTRKLSTNEITKSDYYLIHGKKSTYLSYNDTIYDGKLSGNLDFNKKNFYDPKNIDIYLASDSGLIVNNDRISFPVNSIKKIQYPVPKARWGIYALVGVGTIGISILAIASLINSLSDAFPPGSTTPCSNW
jgi:hypothetical protein